jgi:hypothetical protein
MPSRMLTLLGALAPIFAFVACAPASTPGRAALPPETSPGKAALADSRAARKDGGAPELRLASVTVLVQGLTPNTSVLGLDATSVYWFDQARGLSRAPKAGGEPTVLWPDARNARLQEHTSIAIDDADIYMTFDTSDATEPGRQRLLRQSNHDGTTQVLAQLEGGVIAGVVLDEANVYWVQNGSIMRAAKQGSGRAVRIASGQMPRPHLAVDDARIYWVSHVDDGNDRFVIRAAPKMGGVASVVVKNVERTTALLVDGTNVYWTSGTKVMASSKTSGVAVQLAEAKSWIGGIAIDATHLYFTVPADTTPMSPEGTVWRVAKDGSTTTLLTTSAKSPTGVAVDADSVFWSSWGTPKLPDDGTLSKQEKPH